MDIKKVLKFGDGIHAISELTGMSAEDVVSSINFFAKGQQKENLTEAIKMHNEFIAAPIEKRGEMLGITITVSPTN